MQKLNLKYKKKTSVNKLNQFIKKITGKEFRENKKISNTPWKYLKENKFKFFYLYLNNNIIGVVVIIDFKFTRHLNFLYILKEFRGMGLGTVLFNKYFLPTKKIKTIHVDKNLKKTVFFYEKLKFSKYKKSNNSVVQSWILRCKKHDNKTFKDRYLLFKI